MMKRQAISKKTRFEVFKRDSFRCQYCGAAAPDVLLHVDHIKPVAAGGKTALLNLITACDVCNLGKGARELSDNSVVTKQRTQLDALQERKEQLIMLMDWQSGLANLRDDEADGAANHWKKLAHGWCCNEHGIQNLKRWIRQFSLKAVLDAMGITAEQYIRFGADDKPTGESVEDAFRRIPGICRLNAAAQNDPDIKDLYYLRGIARKRLNFHGNYHAEAECLRLLREARTKGFSIDELREVVMECRYMAELFDRLELMGV